MEILGGSRPAFLDHSPGIGERTRFGLLADARREKAHPFKKGEQPLFQSGRPRPTLARSIVSCVREQFQIAAAILSKDP